MAIKGYGLDGENDNAENAFARPMYACRELIEQWLEADIADEEPGIMGYIAALQVLAQVEPMLAGNAAPKFRIKKWKTAFISWCEKYENKVKVKRGVNREEIRHQALAQFDLLARTVDG